MSNKIAIAVLATTTVAAGVTAGILYNKKRTAEGLLEASQNQLQDALEREVNYKEAMEAMEADRSRMLAILQTYKNEKDAAVESMKQMYDEAKGDNIFEFYEKNIKDTDIGDRIETKYDIDKRECQEAIEQEKEEFQNAYDQMVQDIADSEGISVSELQSRAKKLTYGGHDLSAEEDGNKWEMPSLDEVDDDPAWYVEPHQPDKNGRVAPYEISNLTYTQDEDYKKVAVFYYPMMERLEDEEGAKIEIDKSISWMALTWFGSDPEDPNRIYVRNQELKTDYEVIQID